MIWPPLCTTEPFYSSVSWWHITPPDFYQHIWHWTYMSIGFWCAVLALSLLFCCSESSEGNSEQKARVKFTEILNVFCAEHFHFPVITTTVREQTLHCGLRVTPSPCLPCTTLHLQAWRARLATGLLHIEGKRQEFTTRRSQRHTGTGGQLSRLQDTFRPLKQGLCFLLFTSTRKLPHIK